MTVPETTLDCDVKVTGKRLMFLHKWRNYMWQHSHTSTINQINWRSTSVTGDIKDILSVNLISQTLRGGSDALGSLWGKTSTVQVDIEGIDEGQQAEQCQSNIHI